VKLPGQTDDSDQRVVDQLGNDGPFRLSQNTISRHRDHDTRRFAEHGIDPPANMIRPFPQGIAQ